MIHYDSGEAPRLTNLRTIAIALLVGPIVFGGVVAYLRTSGSFGEPVDVPYLDVGAAGFGVVLAVAAFAMRRVFFARGVAGPPHLRPFMYLTGTMLFFALLEAGMLLNIVVTLIAPHPWPNVGAAVLGLALGANSLPSEQQRHDVGLGD